MSILAFLVGTLLPASVGWLLVRCLEGRAPVLMKAERAALGFVIGLTLCMFITFLAEHRLGMPLHAAPMIGVQLLLLVIFGLGAWRITKSQTPIIQEMPMINDRSLSDPAIGSRWILLLKVLLGLGIAKIVIAGVTFLLLTPAFLDDVIENWNLRAKVFLNDRALTLLLPGQGADMVGGGVNSYPPTVPLAKAWLNILGGGAWNEALANSLHLLWFAAAAILVFAFLRRAAGLFWALLGTYVLVSLPLVVMHATNPYADIFLASHVLAAGTMAASALLPGTPARHRVGFLRVAAVAAACLPFTKNEGLLLYFPPAVLICLIAAAILWKKNTVDRRAITRTVVLLVASCAAIALPWLLYKWGNGLAFGNAKGISFDIAWEPLALLAIVINTFFEANWLLLPALFVLLVLLRGKALLRAPLLVLLIVAGIPAAEQIGIFTLTGLSTEAMQQTGYARGVIHVMPVFVILAVLLAKDWWESRKNNL